MFHYRCRMLIAFLALTSLLCAQTPAKRPPARQALTVDSVAGMAKAGLSEDLVVNAVKKENKAFDLAPEDMIKLKQAGVTDRVIRLMMDPNADVTAGAKVADPGPAVSAPEPAVAAPAAVTSTPPPSPTPGKKRLAVSPFDYSTVTSYVAAIFGSNQDVGRGIQALMVNRLSKDDRFSVLERSKLESIMREQDLGASNRVKQGANARIGQIKGADAILMGDIVIFGRDDKKQNVNAGALFGGKFGGLNVKVGDSKAVVGVNYRLIDAETSEVIATGEARGESTRKSAGVGGLGGTLGKAAGGAIDMTSSNFANTIIGEATIECVEKLAQQLSASAAKLPSRAVEIEGLVASVEGPNMIINVGSNNGVQTGDRFEVTRVVKTIVDPVTKEMIDRQIEKVGDLVITSVRDRTATGAYTGRGGVKAGTEFIVRKQ